MGFNVLIKMITMVVLLGYLTLWIMMPTNIYKQKWQPQIRNKLNNTTYFGTQGTNLFLYTFPVLFIAVLGCVYLQLVKKSGGLNLERNGTEDKLQTWKKPMLVKGPLAIVSWIEVAFLVMFVALLIWSLAILLRNSFATVTPQSAAKNGEKVWESKLDMAALRLGVIGNICLTFLFFPVARGSSILCLFGLTSESSIKYHIWLGHVAMTLFTAHGLCYIIYWAYTNQISEMLNWAKTDISNVAGELALLAGLAMWATTLPKIRRKMFELFFYTHHLYVLFVVFFVFHVGVSYICIMLPGFYLFMVDRLLRFLQSRTRIRLVSARILPCETLELNFSKSPGLKYNPTSMLFLNVPSISKLQWHPFTISSSCNLEPEKLSVVVKSEGTWTKKLYQMLSPPSTSIDHLQVSVEGPYGPTSTHLLRHETLVMVSGGSGITPFISIIKELVYASTTNNNNVAQVLLICTFKNSADLAMLNLLIPLTQTGSTLSDLNIKIEAFVTREKGEMYQGNPKSTRAIWFKPCASDKPISVILGPNHWLWLGAIISSSFIIFLIVIGLINAYYIYPIDHNTNDVFSYPLKAFMNMLVICICIAIAASGGVLWNKRQSAREVKQIQHNEDATPVASPISGFHNADIELESLPHESISLATSVHYGQRPDLKRMLLECKGTTVGVLACGPKKLRHDVAAICSSGLPDNLQFESISFTW